MPSRITRSMLEPLSFALVAYRERADITQSDMADRLLISRRLYILFESERWYPQPKERAHFAKCLHDFDPGLASLFLAVIGQSLDDVAVVVKARAPAPADPPAAAPAVPPPLDADTARRAYDAAVHAAAEELDVTAKTLRATAAALLPRLAQARVSIDQAATLSVPAGATASSKR